MNLTPFELLTLSAAFAAILMTGSTNIRSNLWLYTIQTFLLAAATAVLASSPGHGHLYNIAIAMAFIKAVGIPIFLRWIMKRLAIYTDPGTMIVAPLCMHMSVLLLGLGYFLVDTLPSGHQGDHGTLAGTAAISLLFSGLVVMLTRRLALSQIIGFLVLENGIYLFTMDQTTGMPFVVEMGILLDVLAGVMIAGLVLFRIQRSFEHIDVTRLTELKE